MTDPIAPTDDPIRVLGSRICDVCLCAGWALVGLCAVLLVADWWFG